MKRREKGQGPGGWRGGGGLGESIVYPDGFQMMAEGGGQPPGPPSTGFEDPGQAYRPAVTSHVVLWGSLRLHRRCYDFWTG